MTRLSRPQSVFILGSVLAGIVGLALVATGGTGGAALVSHAQADLVPGAFLPIAIKGRFPGPTALPVPTVAASPTEARPTETVAPSPTVTATETPTAIATETAVATETPAGTPTPLPDDWLVMVQIATFGGLVPDTQFGADRVRQAPWYTFYHDATVVTFAHVDGRPDRHAPRVARLSQEAEEALQKSLFEDIEFFDLAAPDETGLCTQNLDTTHILVSNDGITAFRTMAIYGLEWYLRGEAPCRPRVGTPEPLSPQLVALARLVADLQQPIPDWQPYWPAAGTLVVSRDRPTGDAPAWPLPHRLDLLSPEFLEVGEVALGPDDAPLALQTVAERVANRWSMARFAQGDERYYVGVRVEPPHWAAYQATPEPTASHPTDCPVPPRCTPGPLPTRCIGPHCPTPNPCPTCIP